jgi:hypothetical protein
MNVTKIGSDKFQARVGDFFGPVADSKQNAVMGLDKQLETYHPLDHHYIRCADGTVLHLFQMPSHGWNYRIIPPTGYTGQGVGTMSTYGEARERAIDHANREFGGVIAA